MEDIDDSVDKENKKDGFFKYIFNFEDENKAILLNLFQYSFISIPLIILVLKVINYYTPEEDENKGNLEICLEIIISISSLLIAIWFINKIIRYIPTYSEVDYKPFNETNFILPLFIILFTIQTKLGTKINILVERMLDMIEGKTNLKDSQKKNKKDYKTTQPIAQPPSHQISQADNLNQTQGIPTQNQFVNNAHSPPNTQVMQPSHNFNNAFAGPTTPLVGAQSPDDQSFIPMAANDAMGSMFGSKF